MVGINFKQFSLHYKETLNSPLSLLQAMFDEDLFWVKYHFKVCSQVFVLLEIFCL